MSFEGLWPDHPKSWLVYADEDLVVIDKPAGLASVPEPGRDDDALSRTRRLLAADGTGKAPRLSPSARLDRLASGLVVYGRSATANRSLAAQLEQGIARCYLAGQAPRKSGSPRQLEQIRSNRRRQDIRAPLAAANKPIAGDPQHGGAQAPRLMLHLAQLELRHPRTGAQLHFECPTPAAMQRWLEVGGDALSDEASIELAVRSAAERRWRLAADPSTNAYRLFNGAGDGIDGLTLERYGDYLVASLVGAAARARDRVLDAVARLGPRGIYLKLPPRNPRDGGQRRAELAPPKAVRGVDAPELLWVSEAGLDYAIRLGDGLLTGLFVDQRANRQRIRELAGGQRVLNLFAYTGSFTVAAIAGGASHTMTVDASRPVLDWAAQNVERARSTRSDSAANTAAHALVREDAFEWLRRAARRGEQFDLVIVDPPSFATTRTSRFSAATDYERLAVATLRCVAPGGSLLACTNHRGISPSAFSEQLARAVPQAGRVARRISPLPDPLDCPTLPGQPSHLKAMMVELAP